MQYLSCDFQTKLETVTEEKNLTNKNHDSLNLQLQH